MSQSLYQSVLKCVLCLYEPFICSPMYVDISYVPYICVNLKVKARNCLRPMTMFPTFECECIAYFHTKNIKSEGLVRLLNCALNATQSNYVHRFNGDHGQLMLTSLKQL